MPPVNEKVNSIISNLKAGNQRYIKNGLASKDLKSIREETERGQKPHTAILSCSDSRVVPEYIFDQQPGDLFVIRNAGNIITDEVMGSIEFAVEELGCKLVLVMGHESCGAVTATIGGRSDSNYINSIIDNIYPAVENIKNSGAELNVINTVKENIKIQINKLFAYSDIKNLYDSSQISISGAVYYLSSGEVEFL